MIRSCIEEIKRGSEEEEREKEMMKKPRQSNVSYSRKLSFYGCYYVKNKHFIVITCGWLTLAMRTTVIHYIAAV